MKRCIAFLAALVLLLPVLSGLGGCTKDYSRSDIADYVTEKYGLTEFTVSSTAKEVTDSEGYTDRYWTVRLNDGSDMVFTVVDNYGWGMESVSNWLNDDFCSVASEYLFSRFDRSRNITLALDGTSDFFSSTLTGTFSSRAEFDDLLDEFSDFYDYVSESGYIISIPVDFQHINPLRSVCSYTVDDGDVHTSYSEFGPEQRRAALNNYILTCLDYRFEDQLSGFTDDEIFAALSGSSCCIAVSRSGLGDDWAFYQNLGASIYSYGISFATLYEILVYEGYNVAGTPQHYSFSGADGHTYEISYDFCDYTYTDVYTGEPLNGYYYLTDGEITPMNYYFHNHFSEKNIALMTGLSLKVTSFGAQLAADDLPL